MRGSYVSISGLVEDADIEAVRQGAGHLPASHRLAAGVLVSAKTLRGLPTTSRRYPLASKVEGLLSRAAEVGAWPVVHYNTRAEGYALGAELATIAAGFPSMRGLQLNVEAPDPETVRMFARDNPEVEIILQVGRAALPSFGKGDPQDEFDRHCNACEVATEARAYVDRYDGVAHVLLDASAGEGRGIDPLVAGAILGRHGEEWTQRGMRVGIAGGLGPGAAAVLAAVEANMKVQAINRFVVCAGGRVDGHAFKYQLSSLSFCAESALRFRVRDALPGEKHQDALDLELARAWPRLAAQMIQSCEGVT